MNQIFNNRELASGILFALFILWCFSKHEVRKSFLTVLKAFLNLLTVFACFTCYVLLSIYLLESIQIWDSSQVKNTVMWYLFVGVGTFFGIAKARDSKNYFVTLFNQQFKVIVFIGFLIGLHSYNIFAELFLVTFTTILVVMNTYSKFNTDHQPVEKLSERLLAIIGTILIFHNLYLVYLNPDKHMQLATFQNFLVPLLLTVMLIPFLFCVAKFMAYETGLIQISIYTDSRELRRYAKFKSLIAFKGNIELIRHWLCYSCASEFESKKTIQNSIEKYIDKNNSNKV